MFRDEVSTKFCCEIVCARTNRCEYLNKRSITEKAGVEYAKSLHSGR